MRSALSIIFVSALISSAFAAHGATRKIAAEDAKYEREHASTRPASEKEIGAIQEAMQEKLKDADSAKFRAVFARSKLDDPDAIDFCGLVNSKNSYGAYSGFTTFQAFTFGKILPGRLIIVHIDSGAPIAAHVCASQKMGAPTP